MTNKATGFLRYQREKAATRPPAERIHDWHPIQLPVAAGVLRNQTARCMDCGIPFCHQGVILNGMSSGCPINNLIPEWNDLIYQGHWQEAYHWLSKTNNFPEFTGLVCPAPCEAACTLGINDEPVTIKNVELAIIERAFTEGWVQSELPARRTGKRVAIIGSGPAGLACADQLNRVGHRVTVFERAGRVGGLLMYGIPNMKLDKAIVQRRVDLMAAAGVKFVTGVEVGRDFPAGRIKAEFDAIVLCTGATRPRDLPLPGRELAGIHFAVDFLQSNTKSLLDTGFQDRQFIDAHDRQVIVIGGGDTGTDCVATALRHNPRSLTQFEILPHPPLEREPDNPWPQWPRIYQLDYGQEEAAAVFGRDPCHYCLSTIEFLGDEQGHVQAVRTVEAIWETTGNGRLRPRLTTLPRSEKIWPADLVLLAMGFTGPEDHLLHQLQVAQDDRSNVQAEYGRFATSVAGVFAAGDARRGQSLVVWAINEGRGAARECDRYLMGETDLP